MKNPIVTMTEIHRVLADGGWAMIMVPSTDGAGIPGSHPCQFLE